MLATQIELQTPKKQIHQGQTVTIQVPVIVASVEATRHNEHIRQVDVPLPRGAGSFKIKHMEAVVLVRFKGRQT